MPTGRAPKATASKAHPKAKVAKPPTPVSHSSGEHFDENAELEKLNARLNGGDSGREVAMIATPQKSTTGSKSPAKQGLIRDKPATPSKNATPVKSPVQKKAKGVTAEETTVPESTQPPPVEEVAEAAPAPMEVVVVETQKDHDHEGTDAMQVDHENLKEAHADSKVGNGKEDGDPNGATGGSPEKHDEKLGGMRRLETTTTVPDLSLHSHLFMEKVSQQVTSEQWDGLRKHITEWVVEVNEWDPEHPFDQLPKKVAQCCKDLLPLVVKLSELSKDHGMAVYNEAGEVEKIKTAYQNMLKKLHDESKHTESKESGLKKWLEGKIAQAQLASTGLEKQMKDISMEINLKVDSLVRTAQQHVAGDSPSNGAVVDPLMSELENLMEKCSIEDLSRQQTLELGGFSPSKSTNGDGVMTPAELSGGSTTNGASVVETKDTQAKVPEQASDAVPGQAVSTALAVINRKDTMQLQVDHHEEDPISYLQPDGSYLYERPDGKLESWKERQTRLAHNLRMKFNRSFRNAPDEVIRAAQNKKYNRDLISSLFEDWLSSGQNWMQSSVYLNASRTHEQSKRGTYVMKNRAWLVEKYGEGVADSIIENKRQMQLKRKNTDPQYVMENPDIPGSKEHEMYRVFDGLSFEDSETNRFTTGFSSSGQLSEDQTREFMPVILEGSKGMAGALSGFGGAVGGLGAGSAGLPVPNNQNPPGPQKDTRTRNKTKKEVGLKKQCGQKIQAISSKLTELMVLHSKVTVSPLSESMKNGYLGELDARKTELNGMKAILEELYMSSTSEEDIVKDDTCATKYKDAIQAVDANAASYTSTLKTVKLAIDPPKPKAKGKAKARVAPNN